MPLSRTALTYRYESYRAVAAGIAETASSTFLLLVAVRWFDAGAFAKGCIAAGSGLGYLLTPLVVAAVQHLRIPVSRAAARLSIVSAAAMVTAVLIPSSFVYATMSLVAMAAAGSIVPLLTQIYQDNYPDDTRGRFFSRTFMIRIVSAGAFSFAGGALLAADIRHYPTVLLVFAAAMAFSAWCLWHIPSSPLHTAGSTHPLRAFAYAGSDRMFRTTLISWMLMGFANLMMLPLRVEYLANPRYHLELRPDLVALLTGVVPNIARLLLSPVWGWLFDRANFFIVRMTLNAGFALGIVSFFTSDSMPGFVIAAVVYGISAAGGDVAWSLWVTKIAPPARVADYMSVHTFFTGVRGLLAPIAGFALVARYPITTAGWLSALLIVAGTLPLLGEVKHGGLVRQNVAPATPPIPADEGGPG